MLHICIKLRMYVVYRICMLDICNHVTGDYCKAFEFLHEVSTLPRFETIALFLSDAEKKGKF